MPWQARTLAAAALHGHIGGSTTRWQGSSTVTAQESLRTAPRTNFVLHPQLMQDCIPVAELPLCRLLMMNQSALPWFLLVPRRQGLREIHALDAADQAQLLRESSSLAQAMTLAFKPDKLNIAAIGNIVEQLHLHHIARYQSDFCWPHVVWGRLPPALCDDALIVKRLSELCDALEPLITLDEISPLRPRIGGETS